MPRTSPYSITLADAERAELEARARRYTSSYSDVVRARIVLYAAEGLGNDEIAARLDTPRQVVSKWRKRFFDERLAGLTDLPRGGRPPSFPPDVMVAIKALACEFPATADPPQPLARWQCPDLARAAVESGIVAAISGTTIWRWLSSDAIKPGNTGPGSSPRPRLRAQGGPGARPLRSPMRRQAAAARRVRHLRRREDLHRGPHPQTRHHTPGTEPAGARRGGVLPRRLPGLPGRLGRAPRQGVRPLRSHHRHRPVQPADRPSRDHRALRVRASGVLGGRQRLLPSRSGQHRPAPASLARSAPDSPSCARVLAQSSGDLLLRRAT